VNDTTYTVEQGFEVLELAIRLNHEIASEDFYNQGGTREKLVEAHTLLYAIADQFFRSHTGFGSFDHVLSASREHGYTPTIHEQYGNDRVNSFLAQVFDYAAELQGLKVRAYRPERSPSSQSGILGLPPFPQGPRSSELVHVANQTADLIRNGNTPCAVSHAEACYLSAKACGYPDRHVEFLKRIHEAVNSLLKYPGYWEFHFTDHHGHVVERLVIHESERGEFSKAVEQGKVEWLKNPSIVRHERGWPWSGRETLGLRFWKQYPAVKEGDWWTENINQGDRDGQVVAVDIERGQYLWEYEMPKGTTGLVLYGWKQGNHTRRVVSYNSLSDRWLRLLKASTANLIGNPQGGAAHEFQRRWQAFQEAVS
jgi:hypothetical protein